MSIKFVKVGDYTNDKIEFHELEYPPLPPKLWGVYLCRGEIFCVNGVMGEDAASTFELEPEEEIEVWEYIKSQTSKNKE